MPKKIQVISFDLDDTLWPNMPTILHAEKLLYQWFEENLPQISRRYSSAQLRKKRGDCLHQNPELKHDLSALRMRSFQQLAEEFSLDNDWRQTAFDVFYAARQQVTLFDDVQPVLDKLHGQYQLVSLTNGNASPVDTGVDHWFDLSLNAAEFGKKKSEPQIYQQVQKQLNIRADQMVHIGDHPKQDVSGAQLAGVFAIWLNREKENWLLPDRQPDAEIHSLHELPAILSRLS